MSILNSIGNTPMLNLDGVGVKLEYLNPSGSVKDRMAKHVIAKAERTGRLKKGYRVIEATTGNTGIAFSFVCAVKGYSTTIVMPKGLGVERERMIRNFGAELILVREHCPKCAVEQAEKLGKRPRTYLPRQFENPWNIESEAILGKEILKQTRRVDAFVAGVGTGGTLIGAGKAIQKRFPNAKLIAVEPAECPVLSESGFGKHKIHGIAKGPVCRPHRIPGIGDSFIPGIVERNRKLIDDVITIKSNDAIKEAKKLATLGYFVGPSSGANLLAAKRLKRKYKNIVTLFPDRGERYLSVNLSR